MLSQSDIRRRLKEISKEAGIEKPPNPRNIMESTYQHLSDEDHIKSAEIAAGLGNEEEESTLTPEVCPTCGEQLSPGAKACPGCGELFAPDSKMIEEKIQEDMKKSYREVDPEDTETLDKLEQLNDLLKNPEVREMLKEKMG